MKRLKQFFRALTATISNEDYFFAEQHLSECELNLFNQMSIPDRRHCLNVAYTALELAQDAPSVDYKRLIKAALLHDVGRRQGDLSTLDKAIAVIINKTAGKHYRAVLRKQGKGSFIQNIRHALYVSENHPAIGAALLRKCKTDETVVSLVLKHHENYETDPSAELKLLQKADDLN